MRRPDYREIGKFRGGFAGVPVTALTATATDAVRRDIARSLRFAPTAATFKASFFRHNLFIRVCTKPRGQAGFDALVAYLKALPRDGAGIVYCSSRRGCEEMAQDLAQEGLSAAAYHAGMSGKRRHEAQTKWQQGALAREVSSPSELAATRFADSLALRGCELHAAYCMSPILQLVAHTQSMFCARAADGSRCRAYAAS